MQEDDLEVLVDQRLSDMKLKLNRLNQGEDILEQNQNVNRDKASHFKTIWQMYKHNIEFVNMCKTTTFEQLSAPKANDFICTKCRSHFLDKFNFDNRKCFLCLNEKELNLLHVLEHKIEYLFCEICDENFENLDLLLKHINSKHNFIVYNCFCCDNTFQLKYSLVYHLLFVHKLKKANISKFIEYHCTYCKKNLTKYQATDHMLNVTDHDKTVQLPFVINCMICKNVIE